MKALISATIALFLLGSSLGYATKVYKWVDDEGVVNYGDTQPENTQSITVRIQTKQPDQQPAQKTPSNETNSEDTASKPNQTGTAGTEDKKVAQKTCKEAHTLVNQMKKHNRVRINENGKLRFLSEEEKQEKLKKAEQYISDHCK